MEELVATATTFLLTFLQRLQQSFCSFTGCSKVADIFLLNRIHTSGILHIHKVDDVELASWWHLPGFLVYLVVIIQLLRKSRELVIIYNHSKPLGTVLADERLNDGESLTGTRSTNYPCSSERIHDIHPTFAELALVVIAHRDVYAILVLLQFLALLKRLVLEVETVFEQSFLQELGDIVKGNMDADGTKNRGSHVEPDVQTDGIEPHIHTMTEKPYRQYGNEQSTH